MSADVGVRSRSTVQQSRVDVLVIASCLPTVVIVAAVLIIAGGGAGFIVPAAVVGSMVGMLTYVSVRDRGRPEARNI